MGAPPHPTLAPPKISGHDLGVTASTTRTFATLPWMVLALVLGAGAAVVAYDRSPQVGTNDAVDRGRAVRLDQAIRTEGSPESFLRGTPDRPPGHPAAVVAVGMVSGRLDRTAWSDGGRRFFAG